MSHTQKRDVDRKELVQKILEWNAHRLDLFELSMPDASGSFNGVMRFFYQNESGRYQTKCIRVCSQWNTVKVVDVLHNKFSLSKNVAHKSFSIYEYHASTDLPRRLKDEECPLLVQLNWSKQDRDGKFVLKLGSDAGSHSQFSNGSTMNNSSIQRSVPSDAVNRRRWSLRSKNTSTSGHRTPLGCAAVLHAGRNKHNHRARRSTTKPMGCLHASSSDQQSTCSIISLPESNFTRTKVDGENALGRIRQQTLEAKLWQIYQNPGSDMGGTLKIYGEQICPEVPYRTLLLSGSDTVHTVLRQSLEKYGLVTVDPNQYCLVMRVRSASDMLNDLAGVEHVLGEQDRPLECLFNSSADGGAVTFELRCRTGASRRQPVCTERMSRSGEPVSSIPCSRTSRYSSELDSVFACLIEMDDLNGFSGSVYPLPVHKGQVCVGTATSADPAHPYVVTLPYPQWPQVQAYHLIIWRPPVPPGVTSTMAAAEATKRRGGWLACRPCVRPSSAQSKFATVYVNNHLLTQTPENQACVYWLSPGDIIRLGDTVGTRSLKIWPGDGSTALPRHMIKSTPCTMAHTELPPYHHNEATPIPLHATDEALTQTASPLCYFSPQLYNSTGAMSRMMVSPDTQLSRLNDRQALYTPPKSYQHVPPDSLSASSSSLSGSPLPEPASPGVARSPIAEWLYTSSDSPRPPYRTDCHQPARCANQTISDTSAYRPRSAVACSPASVDSQRIPAFNRLTTQPPDFYRQDIQQRNDNRSSASRVAPVTYSPDTPDSTTSSSVQSPVQLSHHKSTRTRSSSGTTISDRLPCQLAFAPNAVKQLLDWLIPQSLRCIDAGTLPPRLVECPLGPAISVYLMLRAIHRQCDRWEMIESRQLAKNQARGDGTTTTTTTVSLDAVELAANQRQRRQRELLGLALGAVEHLQYFESLISEKESVIQPDDETDFQRLLNSCAAWLANSSQLLHLMSRDVDFGRTFELHTDLSNGATSDDMTAHSAWNLLQEQLTDVVQAAFNLLTLICCTRLDKVALPNVLTMLTSLVESPSENSDQGEWLSEERFSEVFSNQPDAVLGLLTDALRTLHAAYVNPAFVVQLFARILHRLNAQLFNFILGGDASVSCTESHISPAWGRALHRWIRTGLCAWAVTEGLSVATECYLQRTSQAAELMMADVSSVESLYNVVVDLVGLNSRQVHTLLTGYRQKSFATDTGEHSIPESWIDFVVSGVKLVADRLLAEEETAQPSECDTEPSTAWTPRLQEPLDLLLPLLLPEDSYLTDNPIPVIPAADESVSCDSGVSSRPASAKERDASTNCADSNSDPLITVESLRHFLDAAIRAGWCRLSVRPIQDDRSPPHVKQYLSWSAYLASPNSESTCSSPVVAVEPTGSDTAVKETDAVDTKPSETLSPSKMANRVRTEYPASHPTTDYPVNFCQHHQPFNVIVPKMDHSLGLSIVAAKSEDGHDLGIYIRGILPESGASKARLVQPPPKVNIQVPLQPGDRLLSVNGRSVLGLSQESAAALVSDSGPEVRLMVVRNSEAKAIFTNPNFVHLSLGNHNLRIGETNACPECEVQSILAHATQSQSSVSSEGVPVSKTLTSMNLDSTNSPSPHPSLPPTPSALGPVMHLQGSMGQDLDTHCPSFASSNRSSSNAQHDRYSVDCSGHYRSTLSQDGDNPGAKDSSWKLFSPAPSFSPNPTLDTFADPVHLQTSLTANADRPFSPADFSKSNGPLRNQGPCHRPKGQSTSFDDWISASRLKELCDELSCALSVQPEQDLSSTSVLRSSHVPRISHLKSIPNSPIEDCVSTNDFSLASTPRRCFESRTLPSRVHRVLEPDGSSLNTSLFTDRTGDSHTPVAVARTNAYSSSCTWSSRSVGDLPLLDSSAHQLITRRSSVRTIGRPVQRRHTTLTTSRFNLGPRPEPPTHVVFKS